MSVNSIKITGETEEGSTEIKYSLESEIYQHLKDNLLKEISNILFQV